MMPAGMAPGGDFIGQTTDQFALSENFEHPVVGTIRISQLQGDQSANLYVYGIPPVYDEYGMYLLFAPFGALMSCKVIRDKDIPGRHKGYGFVQYAHAESARSPSHI